MDFLTIEFFLALLSIVMIDLVLAGDNAIVIGLAAKNLQKEQQKKAIIWGTVGAVVIRAAATLGVVWLLQIKGLLLVGGIVLIVIAYKLLAKGKDHNIQAKDSLLSAIGTIVVADAIMGIDNVLAVAGAAHGDFLLVVLGLIISVPIMVWGSTMFIALTEKYPVIITIGSAVLALTAAKMITHEGFLKHYFENGFVAWSFYALVVIGVLVFGLRKKSGN